VRGHDPRERHPEKLHRGRAFPEPAVDDLPRRLGDPDLACREKRGQCLVQHARPQRGFKGDCPRGRAIGASDGQADARPHELEGLRLPVEVVPVAGDGHRAPPLHRGGGPQRSAEQLGHPRPPVVEPRQPGVHRLRHGNGGVQVGHRPHRGGAASALARRGGRPVRGARGLRRSARPRRPAATRRRGAIALRLEVVGEARLCDHVLWADRPRPRQQFRLGPREGAEELETAGGVAGAAGCAGEAPRVGLVLRAE
jgi:hypothetical protein